MDEASCGAAVVAGAMSVIVTIPSVAFAETMSIECGEPNGLTYRIPPNPTAQDRARFLQDGAAGGGHRFFIDDAANTVRVLTRDALGGPFSPIAGTQYRLVTSGIVMHVRGTPANARGTYEDFLLSPTDHPGEATMVVTYVRGETPLIGASARIFNSNCSFTIGRR